MSYLSWGRTDRNAQSALRPAWPADAAAAVRRRDKRRICYGLGRSYGDVCRGAEGEVVDMRALTRFRDFDRETGRLTLDAGTSLHDVLVQTVGWRRSGGDECWFPPVLPGTRYVTVGGAIANDVHGKNHHVAGTIGRHVERFTLARSSGETLVCSPTENAELFAATIGGIGLTGAILEATLRLRAVAGLWFEVEEIATANLDAFFGLSDESAGWEHTVAWIDCLARGTGRGRGIFTRARPVANDRPVAAPRYPRITVPFAPPLSPLNRVTLSLFNALYRRRLRGRERRTFRTPFDRNLFPLDSIGQWNRLYGRRGFFQYQCVVPRAVARDATGALLDAISASGEGSFLAVLKNFGDLASPGMLSFPMAGTTLAVDFPNRGTRTRDLMSRLDDIVAEAGGRVYLAKDARLGPAAFRTGYPAWEDFRRHIDPQCASAMSRRLELTP